MRRRKRRRWKGRESIYGGEEMTEEDGDSLRCWPWVKGRRDLVKDEDEALGLFDERGGSDVGGGLAASGIDL